MILFDQINDILIITACLNLLLGIFIFVEGRKERINRIYSLNIVAIISWVLAMIFYRSATQELSLFWCTVLYITPTIIASSFLHFTYIFPSQEDKNIDTKTAVIFFINTLIVIMVAWPNFLISAVHIRPGLEKEIIFSKFYWFYFFYILGFFSYGFLRLFRRYQKTSGLERRQIIYLLAGYFLAANSAFITNLVLPWSGFFGLNWLGQPLTIIMVGFAAYAIFKHNLFNIKVIATEIFSFILCAVSLVNIVVAHSFGEVIFNVLIFAAVLVFSLLLIRSVLQEVRQREQLQKLTLELADANKQLKILDQARSEFITIASHQLRTPPASMKWYLAAIIAGDFGKLTPDVKEQLVKTEATNNSMISLIDDLLNVSRIERGKLEFIYTPTNIYEIAKMTFDQLLPQAHMKKVEMVLNKPAVDLPIITADREKLRQVINNLIDNAIKYTKEGKIEVQLSQTAKDIVVKVIDTGKGVSPDQKKHVFGKFDRGQAAKNSTGLGLGLYVAKVIVEQHKGKIWVESKGEGKGSTFAFSVPIKSDQREETFDLTKNQAPTKA